MRCDVSGKSSEVPRKQGPVTDSWPLETIAVQIPHTDYTFYYANQNYIKPAHNPFICRHILISLKKHSRQIRDKHKFISIAMMYSLTTMSITLAAIAAQASASIYPVSIPQGFFPGANDGVIGSWYRASAGQDATNGQSWCGYTYKNSDPIFAVVRLSSPSLRDT